MSSQLRYLQGYEGMVAALLRALPEEEAMARAVGGDYERIGVLEHALLRGLGLGPGARVVDVGCGSGRLALQLARHGELRYLGLDVVPALLDYARRRVGREDFRFEAVDRIAIPAPDSGADFVVFFSVFTHLLHEESYLYLQEAMRVLRPGGKAVFSFLDYDVEGAWGVFEANLAWVRDRTIAGHLNVFLNPRDLRLWARRLGFRVQAIHRGDQPFIAVDAATATAAVPPGTYALGQSVCVLRKPWPRELAGG
ncbi:class I SAM-dependent methyltransferase [Crenalkalicoccus roseus]|uniref:class I SAM-dependent methyltransferase n=1 Tax=Crenalkalicoccus roseus TaxID=1485588 RepID=UPI001081AEE0|nr:class I SAM-dependent methyltransferase [Crenalkalicoccus roseus]